MTSAWTSEGALTSKQHGTRVLEWEIDRHERREMEAYGKDFTIDFTLNILSASIIVPWRDYVLICSSRGCCSSKRSGL